jgi:hypothetical protein
LNGAFERIDVSRFAKFDFLYLFISVKFLDDGVLDNFLFVVEGPDVGGGELDLFYVFGEE